MHFTADWVTAIGTALTSIAAIGGLIIAWVQLGKLREQIRQSSEQDKRRNTLEACQRYETDTLLKEAMRSLWQASDSGTDYTKLNDPHVFDALTLLNYFEGIATGVLKDIYIEEMVRDYLGTSVNKAVEALIFGRSGSGWKATKPLCQETEFPILCRLYERWNTTRD